MRGTRLGWIGGALLVLGLAGALPAARAAGEDWSGTWVTDEGAVAMTQAGKEVRGAYGRGAELQGEVSGTRIEGTWRNGGRTGRFEFEMQDGGHHFRGRWTQSGGESGTWRGWRSDPRAQTRKADFSGHWLTSLGTFVLTQEGASVKGPWRHQGWDTLEGSVKGRRLEGTLQRPMWRGRVWLETTPDGKRLYGLTDEDPPAAVIGLRLEGFARDPRLEAGEIAQGVAENGMLYFARPPAGWRKGKAVDAVVLLHGSNWTTKGMVWVTANNWPDLAKEHMIVGIQGDQWASWSEPDDLRFNYSYVNWMGRSTYEGYPYTDREAPQLVADIVAELAKKHNWKRVFIGGHSQGGFMAWLMVMHFPERFAGAFPVAGGLVIQAEPDVFEDRALREAQRATPIAIVHGRKDNAVPFETALYIRDRFEGAGFPLLAFIDPELGHPYDFLPIGQAIAWLDAMSTEKPDVLVAFGKEAAREGRWRDVSAALLRAKALRCERKLAAEARRLDAEASQDAARFREHIEKGEGGDWVGDFFAWKRLFAHAPAAAATMKAYEERRAEHDPEAKRLVDEAHKAFREGNRSAGRARYEEVLQRCWLSGMYPIVQRWVADMR